MDGDSRSILEGALTSSSGIATSSGAISAIGGRVKEVVVGSEAVIGTSGCACARGLKINVSTLVLEVSAIRGDGTTGGVSKCLGGSADDGRLCSRELAGSDPEVFSWIPPERTLLSSPIVCSSGVNCDRGGKVSEISANFSSKASPFTDADSLTKRGKAGDSCLDILDPKEEAVLLAVPVLEGTNLAGSFPRPLILSGAIVDVNMVFGPRLRGPSPINDGKDGMGGGGDGDRGGIEPAKDAVIGGMLSNSGNAGGTETTLVY